MRLLSTSAQATQRRPGMVLLVVMGMLSLFAVVALSFVFYADSEAFAAQVARQSMTKEQPYLDTETLAGYFLNQAIYDTENPYSALRGQGMARSLYGYNPNALNAIPYNGTDRSIVHSTAPNFAPLPPVTYARLFNYQRFEATPLAWNAATNYVVGNFAIQGGVIYFCTAANKGVVPPNPGFWAVDPLLSVPGVRPVDRRPEFFGKSDDGGGTYRYVGGANPPWTAYDTNNVFLAAVQANGTVSLPSYYRPWNDGMAANSPAKRYVSLRPDLKWHQDPLGNPTFITPDSDAGGDVRNLDAGLGYNGGNNDSIWLDLGFPVMTAPNGKRYKPLFAPLIVDLSNRLHLWAHGNNIGGASSPYNHVSNMGLASTEVSLGRALFSTADPQYVPKMAELQKLYWLKYGGLNGTAANVPMGAFAFRQGPWYATTDPNGYDPNNGFSTKVSTQPAFTGFTTSTAAPTSVTAGSKGSITLTPPAAVAGGFPWRLATNMTLGIGTPGVNFETVQVGNITNPFTYTFDTAANCTNAHGVGEPVAYNTLLPFPNYLGLTGWDNGTVAEGVAAPAGLNLRTPVAPNIAPLRMSNQEALLRYGATNSPATTSELFRRMPLIFSDPRIRNMVTLRNTYFDRIGSTPFITFDPAAGGKYLYATGTAAPVGAAFAAPAYGTPTNYPANSDFTIEAPSPLAPGTGWRSNLGQRLRVNLNRPLTDYPAPNAAGIMDLSIAAVAAQYSAAYSDRTTFASDILTALIRTTGAQPVANLVAGTPEYYATRWLAQLAVNIVDYIDNDDISTAFNWCPAAPGVDGWVFGTELPRLVLNEVYATYDNNPVDVDMTLMTSTTSKLNMWAELHNPFMTTPGGSAFPNDGGSALLTINGYLNYKIVAYPSSAGLTKNLRDQIVAGVNPTNNPTYNLGVPDAATYTPLNAAVPFDWGGSAMTQKVMPANGSGGGTPGVDFSTATIAAVGGGGASEAVNTVTITTTAAHNFAVGQTVVIAGVGDPGYNGSYQIATIPSGTTFTYFNSKAGLPPSGGGSGTVGGNPGTFNKGYYVLGPGAATFLPARDPLLPTNYSNAYMSVGGYGAGLAAPVTNVTLLLQRLAIPHLPPNATFGATYNPYITVDYVDGAPVNLNRAYADTAANTALLTPAFGTSKGRVQPFAAINVPSQFAAQTGAIVGAMPNSFYGANNPRVSPFSWLTHLDRPLVNQLELRQVSTYKPHELTQQFVAVNAKGAATPFQHRAAWGRTPMATNFLHRALDVLGTPNNMAGTYRGGRWQGNVNLNTVMEPEVFLGLCDPQDATQANPLFTAAQAGVIFGKVLTARGALGSEGTPFLPFSAGDVNRTWVRPDPTTGTGSIFNVGAAGEHPYRRDALLGKILNNITTTSNVFGIYCTVGYFEVLDETVRPARLGAEIGRSENRHIRNRFFAVVDRTGMQLFNTTANAAVGAGASQSLAYNLATVGTGTGVITAWNANQNYTNSNTVAYLGNAYICIQAYPANGAILPTNTQYWLPILQPGMLLEVDSGANAEVVVVKTVGAGSFTADFTLAHAAGVSITCRGNPGPRTTYNPRQDPGVVLHMSVIQ